MRQSDNRFNSSVEFKLLAACTIRPSIDHTDRWTTKLNALADRIGDWPEFMRLVKRHQLPVLTHDALKRLPAGLVPEATLQQLDGLNRTSRLQSLTQIAESKRAAAAFDAAGIAGIQLKGAPLSHRLYGDAYLRSSVDLDLLVSLSQVNKAANVLIDLGQTPIDSPPNLSIVSGQLRQLAYHHCEFVNSALHSHTELHWRLHGWPAALASTEIDKRIPDTTTGFAALQPAVEMVDLLVHGTNHYWYFLKWLGDIQQALITLPKDTWIEIEEKADELGATHSLQLALELCATIFSDIGPAPNFSATPSRSAKRSTRYALQRLNANKVLVHGFKSAVDRSVYRLASATPYGRLTAALRCVC